MLRWDEGAVYGLREGEPLYCATGWTEDERRQAYRLESNTRLRVLASSGDMEPIARVEGIYSFGELGYARAQVVFALDVDDAGVCPGGDCSAKLELVLQIAEGEDVWRDVAVRSLNASSFGKLNKAEEMRTEELHVVNIPQQAILRLELRGKRVGLQLGDARLFLDECVPDVYTGRCI